MTKFFKGVTTLEDLKKEYTIKQSAETVWWYEFTKPNAKGETLIIELSLCTNSGGSHALPVLWKKNGYIDRVLETYWNIEVYVTDTEGASWGRYNPQTKLSEDGKRLVINFDWMLEATEENKEKILNEVYRLFSTATGKTATEEKHDKVRAYAKKYNIEVVTEIPEGWFKTETMNDPIGSVRISNTKLSLKSFRDINRKEALLLV